VINIKKSKTAVSILLIIALASTGSMSVFAGSVNSAKKADKRFIARAEKLYYYEKDREKRYLNYHHKHPKYMVSTIVWQVDADLDKLFYDKPVAAKNPNSVTVLVNKAHKKRLNGNVGVKQRRPDSSRARAGFS